MKPGPSKGEPLGVRWTSEGMDSQPPELRIEEL